MNLLYSDDDMAVELGDQVRFTRDDGFEYEGRVTNIYPRLRKASVKYPSINNNKSGDPMMITNRIDIADLALVSRDQ